MTNYTVIYDVVEYFKIFQYYFLECFLFHYIFIKNINNMMSNQMFNNNGIGMNNFCMKNNGMMCMNNMGMGMNNMGMGINNIGMGMNNMGMGMNNIGIGMNNLGMGMVNMGMGMMNNQNVNVNNMKDMPNNNLVSPMNILKFQSSINNINNADRRIGGAVPNEIIPRSFAYKKADFYEGINKKEKINIVIQASSGMTITLPSPPYITIAQLFKNYIKKINLPDSVLGKDITFIYEANVLYPFDNRKLFEKFKDNSLILVIDTQNIISA